MIFPHLSLKLKKATAIEYNKKVDQQQNKEQGYLQRNSRKQGYVSRNSRIHKEIQGYL